MNTPRADWKLTEENVARYLCTAAFVLFAVWLVSELRDIDGWLGLVAGVILSGIPMAWLWVRHLERLGRSQEKAENAGYGPAFAATTGRVRAVDREKQEAGGGQSMGIGPGRDDAPHPQPGDDEDENSYP